jgi:uncharacterized repeat protein (TIGR01451 family)
VGIALVLEQFPLASISRADDPPRTFTDDSSMHSTQILQLNPTVDANGSCTQGFASGYAPNTPSAPQSGGFNQTPKLEHRVVTTPLAAFAGRQVQIRFNFATGDALYNKFEGWYVDNIKVTNTAGDVTTTTFEDHVDGGANNGWTTIGDNGTDKPGWHITTRRSSQFGGYSWWYGREGAGNYQGVPTASDCADTANSGALTSPAITLGSNPTLEFDTLWQIESVDAQAFDLMRVFVEDLGVPPANVSVTKAASADSVGAGTPLTYMIQVSNNPIPSDTQNPAPAVVLNDSLPAGTTLVSATPTQGSCSVGAEAVTFTCSLGPLPAPTAGPTTATIVAVIVPTTAGTIKNTASVSSGAPDPDPSDNTASVETQVTAPPLANINGSCPHDTWLSADTLTTSPASIHLACTDYWWKISAGAQQRLSLHLSGASSKLRIAVFRDLAAIAQEWRDKANGGTLSPQQLNANLSGLAGSPWDAGPWDAGPWDAGPWDAGPWDAGPWDAGPWDAGPWDAGPWDAGPWDAGPWDAGSSDAATYAIAQIIGLMAVSSNGEIVGNTWNNAGDFYVRVWNESATPAAEDVAVSATFTDTCSPSPNPLVKSAPTVAASTPRTLILTNTARIKKDDGSALSDDEVGQLLAQLAVYATRPEVAPAVVVDLKNVNGMAANYSQWDSNTNPSCIQAANIVADAIHDVVAAYRSPNLEYIQIVGGDQAVPYIRMIDSAEIYGEENYNPPVVDASASRPPFGLNYLLSQDYYASFSPIAKANHVFYPPDVGIARLVESYEDILFALGTYRSVNGVLPNSYVDSGTTKPTSAFVAGHTFLSDLATFQASELGSSGLPTQTLISTTPSCAAPATCWSRTDFLGKFVPGTRYGFLGIHSHFAANAMLAADGKAIVGSTEFAPLLAAQLPGAFVMSNGCHAGYNIIRGDAPVGTQDKDFPQVVLRNGGGGLLASTTYAYGDTDFLGYTEDLIAKTTHNLRYPGRSGDNAVVVSKAVTTAKRDHINEIVAVTGVDEKAVASLAQYGLVTYAINFPSGRLPAPTAGAGLTPGAVSGGLATATLSPSYNLNLRTVPISGAPAPATYYSLDDPTTQTVEESVALLPSRPVLPLYRRNIASTPPNTSGLHATGAVLRSANYTDETGQRVLFAQALTEQLNLQPYAPTIGFEPTVPYGLNQRLGETFDFTPVQLQCGVTTDLCTRRKYTGGTFTIYYSNKTGLDALRGPLTLPAISAVATGPNSFRATVRVGGTDNVTDLLITYTATGGSSYGQWRSRSLFATSAPDACDLSTEIDLVTPATVGGGFLKEFTCDINLPSDVDPLSVRFFVQAVSGGGFVTVRTGERGFAPSPTLALIGTRLAFDSSSPTMATYDSRRRFTVTLTDAFGSPLSGRDISISLGGVTAIATSGLDGTASTILPIAVEPRGSLGYDVSARFDGDPGHDGSTAVRSIVVGPAPTEFVPLASGSVSPPAAVTFARLQASIVDDAVAGGMRKKPMNEVPVFINNTVGPQRSTRTNASGEVIIEPNVQDLAAGTITLMFAGTMRYATSSSVFSITCVSCALNTAPTVTVSAPAAPLLINTTVVASGTFADPDANDLHVAQLQWGDGALTAGSLNETTKTYTGTHVYTSPGVYEVRGIVTDRLGASGNAAFDFVAVFDPNAGYVSGGVGSITSPLGSCRDPLCVNAAGTGNFGYVVGYKPKSNVVIGVTAYLCTACKLKFISTALDPGSLVVSGGQIQYTGSGRINGSGNYGFKVIATDGQFNGANKPDKFRIIIWKKNADGSRGATIYDSGYGTAETLGSGTSINSPGQIIVLKLSNS